MAGNLRMTISEFMQRHPDMQFDATEAGRESLLAGLDAHIIDAVIIPAVLDAKGLNARRLWSERLLIALPDGHALLTQEAIHWTDLRREVFVLPRDGIGPTVAAVLAGKLGAIGLVTVLCRSHIYYATLASNASGLMPPRYE
jgi:DNA-binding transcriptional LysR family regulator